MDLYIHILVKRKNCKYEFIVQNRWENNVNALMLFAEMIEKNKKEREETKKELKEEIKKELELALNKDKKNIEDLNKKIERLETVTNEFQSIKE
jgi:uncharacterized protein YlxW (UPF0749 family)